MPDARRRCEIAQAGIECRQIKKSHHQLGALRDVLDGFGRQRMHGPDKRDRHGQRSGHACESSAKIIQTQSAPDDRPQQQRRQCMHDHVEGVIANRVEPAEVIVDRQRKVDQRPAGRAEILRRIQGPVAVQTADERPKLRNRAVLFDRAFVVK